MERCNRIPVCPDEGTCLQKVTRCRFRHRLMHRFRMLCIKTQEGLPRTILPEHPTFDQRQKERLIGASETISKLQKERGAKADLLVSLALRECSLSTATGTGLSKCTSPPLSFPK